jgi:aminoglycoside phosphotransferase (APT) family kinase protein
VSGLPGAADLAGVFAVPPSWLLAALDGPAVVRAARGGAVSGVDGEVVGCVPLDVRLAGGGWRVWYALAVRDHDGGTRTVDVTGDLVPPTPAGPPVAPGDVARPAVPSDVALRPVTTGVDLPGLHVLTDPSRAAGLVERLLGEGPFRGLHLAACSPRVVRHARGARVTVVLALSPAPGADPGAPDVVVAKAYRDDEGAATHAAMTRLWGSRLATHPDVTVARPLGYDPVLGVLLQAAVPHERTLTELVVSAVGDGSTAALDRLRTALRRTADGLVALHASGVDGGPVRTPEALLARAAKAYRRLAEWVPDAAAAAEPVLSSLAARAARVPPDVPAPSHGGFRPAQVLLDAGDHPAFIDFDGFCVAEPAFDVGRFRARLREIVLSAPAGAEPALSPARLSLADRLADEVGDRYATRAPLSAERVALWEDVELVTALVQSWTRGQVARTPSLAALVAASAG